MFFKAKPLTGGQTDRHTLTQTRAERERERGGGREGERVEEGGREREGEREKERGRERENSELYYSRIEVLGSSLFLQSVLAKLYRQHL